MKKSTLFERSVWKAVTQIPFGSTMTYKDVATSIGKPRAARAVGNALNKNPVPILTPCHRVIPSRGAVGGYVWGHEMKAWLLKHEAHLKSIL